MSESRMVTAEEVTEATLKRALEIRNGIFSPITLDDWRRGDPKSGSLAIMDGEPVGFIPLFLRELQIAPGVTITTAFENAVGTKDGLRGLGVGSKMIEGAADFLRGKADALFVYRGSERSAAYNFYSKTGHVDMMYTRGHVSGMELARMHEAVQVSAGAEAVIERQSELLRLFEDTYAGYGGFPRRHAKYWEQALQSTYFSSRPADFYFFTYEEEGVVTAYVIASKLKNPMAKQPQTKLNVLEMASASADPYRIKCLLEHACHYAPQLGLDGLAVSCGDVHPFLPVLDALGFERIPRGVMTMAYSFDSPALFEKAWKRRFHVPGVEVRVWTPKQDFVLQESPSAGAKCVTIEMKEETLTRWLMGRIDFRARVREGTITVCNGTDDIIEAVADAIPHVKWEYHHLDFC